MEGIIYIHTALLFISLMMTGIFILAWRTMERTPHALTWALAFLFFAFRILMVFLSGYLPPAIVSTSVSVFTLISLGLGLYGWRQRANLHTNLYIFIGYFLVYLAVIVFADLIYPHVGIYYSALPLCAATVFIMDCVIIARAGRKLRAAEWSIIVVYLLFAVIELVAAYVALMQGPVREPYYHSLYTKINFLFMPAAFVGMGLFAVLILVDDLSHKMKVLAATDALTGLINRRGFEKALRVIIGINKRSDSSAHIVLIDLDHFKSVNDSFGHAAGDFALKEFANVLRQNVRSGDIAGRIGGEEFALILPSTDQQTTVHIVERIRSLTSSHRFRFKKVEFGLTASFGVAPLKDDIESFEDALAEADEALYRAKNAGRDRVEISSEPEPQHPS